MSNSKHHLMVRTAWWKWKSAQLKVQRAGRAHFSMQPTKNSGAMVTGPPLKTGEGKKVQVRQDRCLLLAPLVSFPASDPSFEEAAMESQVCKIESGSQRFLVRLLVAHGKLRFSCRWRWRIPLLLRSLSMPRPRQRVLAVEFDSLSRLGAPASQLFGSFRSDISSERFLLFLQNTLHIRIRLVCMRQ